VDEQGNPLGPSIELSEEDRRLYGNLTAWMILAQLARRPSVAGPDGRARVDLTLLLEIGACPLPLMRVGAEPVGHLTHEIPGYGQVLCHENGIAEPITASIFHALATEGPSLDFFIDEAIRCRSLALLSRIDVALRQVHRLADKAFADW